MSPPFVFFEGHALAHFLFRLLMPKHFNAFREGEWR